MWGLWGNESWVVWDDGVVRELGAKLFAGARGNEGQGCLAAKRIYAPRAVYDARCEELAKLAREAVVDDGLNQGAQIGPLQNRQQYEKVLEIIEDAKAQGTVLAGDRKSTRLNSSH